VTLVSRVRSALARNSYDPKARPVLVVDDDAGVRAYIAAVLEHQGYRVIAAGSGEEALELLGDEPAQLAVLDFGLPGMDGIAVAEQLNGVPVIVVTGTPDLVLARDPNMRVLSKPVAPEEIERAVAEAI
jgi:DNA-binding response OmpR family regulator